MLRAEQYVSPPFFFAQNKSLYVPTLHCGSVFYSVDPSSPQHTLGEVCTAERSTEQLGGGEIYCTVESPTPIALQTLPCAHLGEEATLQKGGPQNQCFCTTVQIFLLGSVPVWSKLSLLGLLHPVLTLPLSHAF